MGRKLDADTVVTQEPAPEVAKRALCATAVASPLFSQAHLTQTSGVELAVKEVRRDVEDLSVVTKIEAGHPPGV